VSREEAVEAYTAGRISRRTFVRHLVMAGVTVAAAVTYADVLAPGGASQASSRQPRDDLYPEYPEYPEQPVEPGAGTVGAPGAVGAPEPARPVRDQPRFTR
jgi:hypothetical protein